MNKPANDDYSGEAPAFRGRITQSPGGQPPLQPPSGGDNYGGMDPWQTSVENRLGSLQADMSTVKVEVGKLVERVAHLPTKGFIIVAVLGTGAVLSVITAFAPAIQHALGLTH